MKTAAAFVLAVAFAGCVDFSVPPRPSNAPSVVNPPIIPDDVFSTLKPAALAHAQLCNNDGGHPNFPNDADHITRAFCQDLVPGGKMPEPHGLADLLALLDLDFKDPNGGNGTGGNPAFAILGHSSALTARKVTTLTPTAFVFTPPPTDGSKPSGYVFLAFDPGEQFVEVASHDPTADQVNLYLVLFEKDCAHTQAGCPYSETLTPNLVTGWSNVRVYEASTDLNNTIADCRECHAPVDANPQILRMQELADPHTHWFDSRTAGGQALLADFHAAHGSNEDYGPIPAALVDKSDPDQFAAMVRAAGFGEQPNAFNSPLIESEVAAMQPEEPILNLPRGWSATWQGIFDNAVSGNFIAAPYHDVKVTDPDKLARMTQAYRQWMAGSLADLPNVGDVFLDDGLREMGFAPQAGLDGRGLLVQMCQQCHNANLDMTISREKFLVDELDQMSPDEKTVAIQRIQMEDSRLKMPPLLFRTVTDDERQAMIAELSK